MASMHFFTRPCARLTSKTGCRRFEPCHSCQKNKDLGEDPHAGSRPGRSTGRQIRAGDAPARFCFLEATILHCRLMFIPPLSNERSSKARDRRNHRRRRHPRQSSPGADPLGVGRRRRPRRSRRHGAGARARGRWLLALRPGRGASGWSWSATRPEERDEAKERERLEARRETVLLLGRRVRIMATEIRQIRADDHGEPASGRSTLSYIRQAFGDNFDTVRAALAASCPPEELNRAGFHLDQRFRPQAPDDFSGGARRAS